MAGLRHSNKCLCMYLSFIKYRESHQMSIPNAASGARDGADMMEKPTDVWGVGEKA